MEEFIYNKKLLKERRRELRKRQTLAEKTLWYKINNRKILGHRFTRQYGVGPYILDFFCPKTRLAIEVDGEYHLNKEVMLHDKVRSEYLRTTNIKIIRFWNNEVLEKIDWVLQKIKLELNNPLDPPYFKGENS